MVSQINPCLFIGAQEEAENDALVKQLKITTIINVNNRETEAELKVAKNNQIEYIHFPTILNDPNVDSQNARRRLFKAADHLCVCLKAVEPKRTLIHCEAGIDRAPFVVAVAFKCLHKCSLADAYKMVKKQRPQLIEHLNWAQKQ
jgi:protein tyrosine/serine phosphatase